MSRRISILTINGFNPIMADGVSSSMFEVLLFLRSWGYEVSIIGFLTCEPYKRRVFERLSYYPGVKNIGERVKSCCFALEGVDVEMELLPYRQGRELFVKHEELVKDIRHKLTLNQPCYVFTLENDLISSLTIYLLDVPGAHFFHSLACVYTFANWPFSLKFLRHKQVFSVSRFLQKKVKELLGLDSVVWHPLINPERCLVSKNEDENKGVGFYSAGLHKGDEIVKRLIEKLPKEKFAVMGRNYSFKFGSLPQNLNYLGDVEDVRDFFSHVRILIVPSLVEEAFSRVIIEAAINGIPVIANRVGGIPEAMGDSGILVDVDFDRLRKDRDAEIERLANEYAYHINRLMKNKAEYEHYRQKALKRAKEYLEEQEANNLYIYENYIKPYLS